ncbi:hypothetical protein N5853_12670 [Bartonella sp. HY329]|uniref:hypothetical protein n=1 Tax=unclassified Bartonella TaxID=2645622 RepID=UPI0021C83F74|nr:MULTISPECIES: hypothetical protein [unclassified Bartonella]UXM94924.1 hypothetical protein N5853_12670 [Bartonella sp. HY329]UXN09247.1 hypothetical protein N5852_12680 [Bartonella sp. HY328]
MLKSRVKGSSLPNIEQVIRHALEKIDTQNSELREQVYRAVWESHERTIVEDSQLSDEDRNALRNMLISLIQTIEEEYNQASASTSTKQAIDAAFDAEVFEDTRPQADNRLDDANRMVDDIENGILQEVDEKANQDKLSSIGPEELGFAPSGGHASRPQKHHSWWRSNLVLMILLVLLVLVAWSFYKSLTAINRPDGASPETSIPPATIGDQNQMAQSEGWITVFDPTRISDFSVQGSAEAQIKGEGNNRALRFKSNSLDDKVVINISSGVIEQLRGKLVTFNVIARSANDTTAQLAITCQFGSDDGCGKLIFNLPQTRDDFLFSAEIPQNFNQDGQLFLQSALLGPEYEIDIFAVRVHIEK